MADPTANGIYSIATYNNDDYRTDVDGATLTSGANIQIYKNNDTNAQKVQISTVSGYRRIRAVVSGLMYDVKDGPNSRPGTNIWQYWENGTVAQDWTFTQVGIADFPWGTEPVYTIKSRVPQGFVMDYQGGNTANDINVWAYTPNGSTAQWWTFHRDTYFDPQSFTIPSNIGGNTDTNAESKTLFYLNADTAIYPMWRGTSGDYQLRYRTRERRQSNGTYTAWSNWMTPEGNPLEYGWGNAWVRTGVASQNRAGYLRGAAITFSPPSAGMEKVQVQFNIRGFQTNGNSTYGSTHGTAATGGIEIRFQPTFTYGNATFSPDGVRIPIAYNLNSTQNKARISLNNGPSVLVRNFEQTIPTNDDIITIPISSLNYIPQDGESFLMAGTLTTPTGVLYNFRRNITIRYTAGHGTTINDTWEEGEGYTEIVSFGSHDSDAVWLLHTDGTGSHLIPCDREDPDFLGSGFIVPPPFNSTYQVFMLAVDGTNWATKFVTRRYNRAAPAYVWNYYNTQFDFAALSVDTSMTRDIQRDYEANMTSGRETESVVFGNGSEYDMQVRGVVSSKFENQDREAFERLAHANYATFRTPWGEIYRVAIISVNRSKNAKIRDEISIQMKENS